MTGARDDVVVVVPDPTPRWVLDALGALAGALGDRLRALVRAANEPAGGGLAAIYRELDRRRFAEARGPLTRDRLTATDIPVRILTEPPERCGVVLSFAGREAAAALTERAEAALFVELAGPEGAWLGFRELVSSVPLFHTRIFRVSGDDPGTDRVVATHRSRTHRLSFHRTREVHAAKLAAIAARVTLRILEEGQAAEDGEAASIGVGSTPSALAVARLGPALIRRKIRSEWSERAKHRQWFVALARSHDALDRILAGQAPEGLEWLDPPSDRFWADPFPAPTPDGHVVFVEEYLYDLSRARISCFELSPGRAPGLPVPVLEEPHHLSYPFVFEWSGDWYMLPEASESNGLVLYKAREFPHGWEPVERMAGPGAAVDATLVEIEGRWWMFSITQGERAESWDEDLNLHYADTPLGPWRPHRRNPVRVDAAGARPAGPLLRKGSRLYRPGQDCVESYGRAIRLHEIRELSTDRFLERHVATLAPEWRAGLTGTHTVGGSPGLVVLDGVRERMGRRPPH